MCDQISSSIQNIEIDYKCNGKCPTTNVNVPYFDYRGCCANCSKSRLGFRKDNPKTQEFWSDDKGFWNKFGCRLPREWYPDECKKYDCRTRVYYIRFAWAGNQGFTVSKAELLAIEENENIKSIWTQLYNEIQKTNEKVEGK